MTSLSEHHARIGRALSAVLQAIIAEEMSGAQDAASSAFLQEYEAELATAAATGPGAMTDLLLDLFGDLSTALFSVTKHSAQAAGEDPKKLLGELIRTYRKAGRDE